MQLIHSIPTPGQQYFLLIKSQLSLFKAKRILQIRPYLPQWTWWFHKLANNSMEYSNSFMFLKNKVMARIKDPKPADSTFMSQLIKRNLECPENEKLSDQDLIHHIVNFFLQYERINTVMANAILDLARNPELLKSTVQDIQHSSMPSQCRTLAYVINESVRLHNPLPYLIKKSDVSVKLGGRSYASKVSTR